LKGRGFSRATTHPQVFRNQSSGEAALKSNSPQTTCHPERSVAKSKDLLLLFLCVEQSAPGRPGFNPGTNPSTSFYSIFENAPIPPHLSV
jgi:hypothetical protein